MPNIDNFSYHSLIAAQHTIKTVMPLSFLSIGFDHSNGRDETVMTVGTNTFGLGFRLINILKGQEAIEMYEKLTGLKIDEEVFNNDQHH